MRVLMPILEYHPLTGGAQRQIAAVAPRLGDAGVEVEVWTRAIAGQPAFEQVGGVSVHRLGRPGAGATASFLAAAAARLPRARADLVHAYSLFSPALIALAAKQWLGIPAVVKVLRGGALGDLERLVRKPFGARRAAALARRIDCFVAISEEIDAELARLGVPGERRRFVPNGVDTERFQPVDASLRRALRARLELPDVPIALYCGRLVPEKQVDVLLAAWASVRRDHPDALLVALGDGPAGPLLREAAGPGVRFLGDRDDVAPYLRAADLFVLPSRTEGLSNALLEAMATGLPVIATDVGGARDALRDGACGCLVPSGDRDALAAALGALLADGARRAALGRAARERTQSAYALAETASDLVALYRDLTATPRRGTTTHPKPTHPKPNPHSTPNPPPTFVQKGAAPAARRSCHG